MEMPCIICGRVREVAVHPSLTEDAQRAGYDYVCARCATGRQCDARLLPKGEIRPVIKPCDRN
jgi:hypothetical protein